MLYSVLIHTGGYEVKQNIVINISVTNSEIEKKENTKRLQLLNNSKLWINLKNTTLLL